MSGRSSNDIGAPEHDVLTTWLTRVHDTSDVTVAAKGDPLNDIPGICKHLVPYKARKMGTSSQISGIICQLLLSTTERVQTPSNVHQDLSEATVCVVCAHLKGIAP